MSLFITVSPDQAGTWLQQLTVEWNSTVLYALRLLLRLAWQKCPQAQLRQDGAAACCSSGVVCQLPAGRLQDGSLTDAVVCCLLN